MKCISDRPLAPPAASDKSGESRLTTHRLPNFWDEPEVFDPDRWTREREAGRHGHAYHPFAAPR